MNLGHKKNGVLSALVVETIILLNCEIFNLIMKK